MKNGFYNCAVYGWNKDNLNLSEKMHVHLKHHTGNGLCVVMGGIRGVLREGNLTEGQIKKAEKALAKCQELADYFKQIEEFISAA